MNRSFKALLGEPGAHRNIKIAIGVLALVDLVFYLFAIGPLAQSDRERRMEVEKLSRLAKDRWGQVEKLKMTVKKVETARTEGNKLLETITLPRRTAFSAVVSELTAAAKKAGVELRDSGMNFDQIEGSDTLSMLTITQGLEGNYDSMVKFLNLLDRSSRFLIIESLGAAPLQSQQQKKASLLAASLKLDTFVKDEGPGAATPPPEVISRNAEAEPATAEEDSEPAPPKGAGAADAEGSPGPASPPKTPGSSAAPATGTAAPVVPPAAPPKSPVTSATPAGPPADNAAAPGASGQRSANASTSPDAAGVPGAAATAPAAPEDGTGPARSRRRPHTPGGAGATGPSPSRQPAGEKVIELR